MEVENAEKEDEIEKVEILDPVMKEDSQAVTKRSRRADLATENGKKKNKEEKPNTKIVVRRLPPAMSKESFLEQISPVPTHDYMYYVQGDPSQGVHSFSRAYINFVNQDEIFAFSQTFDNYIFLDGKGQEYPAVVEFAPYQRVPKTRTKKKDPLCGTIESDPIYIAFKEALLAEPSEMSGAIVKQHYFETEISTAEKVNTTPLLEFLRQKRAEKARIRDEKREEKKRKDAERKQKQKGKEKKVEGEEEEDESKFKTYTFPSAQYNKKELGPKTSGEAIPSFRKDPPLSVRHPTGVIYSRNFIEGKIKSARSTTSICTEFGALDGGDLDAPQSKAQVQTNYLRQMLGIPTGSSHTVNPALPSASFKTSGFLQNEFPAPPRRFSPPKNRPSRGEVIIDNTTNLLPSAFKKLLQPKERRDDRDSRKKERRKDEKDNKFVKEPRSREFKARNGKSYAEERAEKRDKMMAEKKNATASHVEEVEGDDSKKLAAKKKNSELPGRQKRDDEPAGDDVKTRRSDKRQSVRKERGRKRRDDYLAKKNIERKNEQEKRKRREEEEAMAKQIEECKNRRNSLNSLTTPEFDDSRDTQKRRSSLESDVSKVCVTFDEGFSFKKDDPDDKKPNKTKAKRAFDAEGDSKSSKDPRSDRRIRNKDRPSIQIYRPGMGKFSKQRLEKEKVGSSTEMDSPSHSPSPKPNS